LQITTSIGRLPPVWQGDDNQAFLFSGGFFLEFSLNHHDGYFEIKIFGKAELQGYGEFLDALLAHEDWVPGSLLLVDEMDLDTSSLSSAKVQEIADACVLRRDGLGNTRCAILVGGDLEYGFVRMWGVFVEDQWDVIANLFKTRDEALDWLL